MKTDQRTYDEDLLKHLDQVANWLSENVRVYPAPKEVMISKLAYDEDNREGSFDLYFDQQKIDEKIGFMFEMAKKPHLTFPKFHSPLGAPATYSQVQFTYGTKLAIIKAVYGAYQDLLQSSEQIVSQKIYREMVNFQD